MFDHPVVATALGLVLFYVLFSMLVAAIQEWLASLFSLRAKNLRAGIIRLLGDEEAARLYGHPLVRRLARTDGLPSYLSSDTLSAAALDLVTREQGDKRFGAWSSDELRDLVDKVDDAHPLKGVLSALLTDGVDTADSLAEKLADWFDEAMTRISGWYNRRAKLLIVLVATALTVAANASTVHVAEALWRNDALRTTFAAEAQAVAAAQRLDPAELPDLPLGWMEPPEGPWGWLRAVLGWALTVAAVSLGAPFWFDLLGKVAHLKGTGGEPPRRPRPGASGDGTAASSPPSSAPA